MAGVGAARLWVTQANEPAAGDEAAERELVARAKRDPGAFAPLYDRYAERVYWYAYHRLGEREAAEDAASATFAKAIASIGSCRDDRFRPWLYAIARNAVTDQLRGRRETASLAGAVLLPDRAASPEERALAQEGHDRVRALLARLPEGQRQIVALRLAGLTGAEIARVLGKTHVAVRVTQVRAYQRLRRILDDDPEAV